MICNPQDTNLSWYVPKANVDDTIEGKGTSNLDHLVSTPTHNLRLWMQHVLNYSMYLIQM